VTVYISKPTFPTSSSSGATTYAYYTKQPGGTWATVIPSTATQTVVGNYIRVNFTYRDTGASAKSLWFKVGVRVTPTGWGGGSLSNPVYCNAVGTSPIDTDKSVSAKVTGTLYPDATWTE